jgi:hypothetical protein
MDEANNYVSLDGQNESALVHLSNTIYEFSAMCADSLKSELEDKFGKDSKEFHSKYVEILCEHMYFIIHLTNRSAFSQLGEQKLNKLQERLYPLVVNTTIETLYPHWPNNIKNGIRNDLYGNINSAELEYSKCKRLLPEKGETLKDSLFWELGKNIARLSGHEFNIVSVTRYAHGSVNYFINTKLFELIDLVGKEL